MADSTTFEDADSTIRREGGLVVWRMRPSLAWAVAMTLFQREWVSEQAGLRQAAALATKVPAAREGT